MNKFLMLLKAAEYIDSKKPDVIGSEHDYASSQVYTRPRRDSNPERSDRRDRLRPRPATVKRPGYPNQSPVKRLKRDEDYLPRSDTLDRRRSSNQCNASQRSTHNHMEKIRRHYMRSCFDQLRETIFSTLHDQRQRGKSRSLSPSSMSLSPSSSYSSSSSSCLSASGSRASSQQILNMAHNLIKDLEEECRLLEEEKWVVMKSNTSLKRRIIGFQSIPEKVTKRSRSAETNCSSGRSSYNSSPEFIDVISDASSMSSEDSGFVVSPN